jgi:CDP-glucose 4,6-dehydratase
MRQFWEDKNVFVTGATGFLGYWLVKELIAKDANVVILARDFDPQSQIIRSRLYEKTRVVSGELEDFDAVERAINEYEIEYVFHLGAQTIVGTSYRNPLATFESNIRGTYHVLEACRRHKQFIQGIVIASSDKAYGPCDALPYTEETPLCGLYPYDVSKSCADLISGSYYHTYGLPLAITRCGNLFGGGDLNWSRLIPGTIRSLVQNKSPEIRSDGMSTRDYLFVEDAVQAYLLLASQLNEPDLHGESFNFGPSRPYTVMEIANAIQLLMGRSDISLTIKNHASHEILHQSLNSNKAGRLLGWTPQFSLEEGLKKTIHWYEHFLKEQNAEALHAHYTS